MRILLKVSLAIESPKLQLRGSVQLKEYNTIIEVDGQQHFEPTRIKGVTKEEAEQIFKRTIYNDKIKNKYCYDNDIKMIRISYKEIKNKEYKQIIQSIIN